MHLLRIEHVSCFFRYLSCQSTTTIMTTTENKSQIVESLNALDAEQTEQVLAYIRQLQQPQPGDATYKRFKREAMREIREALGRKRSFRLSF